MKPVRRREGIRRKKDGHLYYVVSERHNCTWGEALEIGDRLAHQVPTGHHGAELRVRFCDRGRRHDVDVWFRLTE